MNRVRTIVYGVYSSLAALVIATVGLLPALIFGERAARAEVRLWAQVSLLGLRAICGIRHVVEGRERLPKGGAIIASNHQSMWETIVFLTLTDKPTTVFKKELLRVPIYGWWARLAGSIPVDRKAGARALRDISAKAARKIAEGCQVIVYPEGTRAPAGKTLPLQSGVAGIYLECGAPCTPAVHDSGRVWLQPGGLFALKIPGVVTLKILPPIEAGLERKAFQRRLEAALGAPTSAVSDAETETAARGTAA